MSPRPRWGIAPPPPALGGGGGGGAIPPSSNPDIPSPPQGLGELPDSTPTGRTMWEGPGPLGRHEVPAGRQFGLRPGGIGLPRGPVFVERRFAQQDVLHGSLAPIVEPGGVFLGEQPAVDRFAELVLVLPCPGRAVGRDR